MQAAIDRVIRSFTFKPATALSEPMGHRAKPVLRDEPSDLAVRLLQNFQGHLARRTQVQD